MRPLVPLLLAVALLLAPWPTTLAAVAFELELSNQTTAPARTMSRFDTPAVALGDFDGDGHLEIVAHNDNQRVYVFSTRSARILAEFRPDYPDSWNVRPLNSPVVADVDGNGRLDIVVVTSAAVTCRYEHDPAGSTSTRLDFDRRWCHRADWFASHPAADGGPWVEDVTGDGRAEIFMQTETKGLFAYGHDGRVLWAKDEFGGNGEPAVGDLDRDGRKEVVFFSDGGTIRAYDAATGRAQWTYRSRDHVSPASVPVGGSLGDLDGDGKLEVVYVARHATHCCTVEEYQENDFMLFVLRHDGTLRWRRQPDWGHPMSYTHPILHDLDGDGKRDVLLMDWNTIGHLPGDWEPLGPANVFAYRHDGTLLWRTQIKNVWSNDDLALADLDGDGGLDVVAVGPDTRDGWRDGAWLLDPRTGALKTHVRAANDWKVLRGPLVADLDGDGRAELVLDVYRSERGGGFLVYSTGAACRVAYGGWQNRDPCRTGAGGGSGGSGGTTGFDATFQPRNGNEWWIQVKVEANAALAGVDARVDGGGWTPLELKWWGDWARSIHAPTGSLVEFRARSTSGATDASGAYRWPGGEPVASDGGGSGLAATFQPRNGNEWWVQVKVTADKPLARVEARVDGGAWAPLEQKWWGDWAASMRAPEGSRVEFRATSTDGSVATSGAYRWTSGAPIG